MASFKQEFLIIRHGPIVVVESPPHSSLLEAPSIQAPHQLTQEIIPHNIIKTLLTPPSQHYRSCGKLFQIGFKLQEIDIEAIGYHL